MTPAAAMAITPRMGASDWARLLFLSLIWGGSFFLIAIAVQDLPVVTLVALRVSIAAVALWIVVLVSGRRFKPSLAALGAFAVMGAVNNVIPFLLIAWGQTGIPAGLASILNATTPLWTVLVTGYFLSDEPLSLTKICGVTLGLGGVVAMMGLDLLVGHAYSPLAQMAILGAAVSYALASTYGRRFSRMGVDPVVTTAGMVTAASVILVPVALFHDGLPDVTVPLSAWAAVFALGTICTGFAYILFFGILARAGATNISLVTFLVPVSAIGLGWMFLGERLGPAHLLGVAMIAGGLSLIDGRLIKRKGP